ncbi:MAG: bifunctional folylpolyglutamate synthase/dihydrofolate synthase, partial [Fimbriimonadaceae bacterium]|nr:bifunctional folylpolyglutamate synthase/dihydrofolate synthase [Chitinophagales bacterium]
DIQPSFFEITVAMAFDYFVKEEIDIALIEVGLGGRLDSTNIISPLLSIITNISYDHMHMLGNTLPEIASEKAGIIKQNIPVVIGEYNAETFPVFLEKANSVSAPIYLAEENIDLKVEENDAEKLIVNASYMQQLVYPNLQIGLKGNYQIKNTKTVLQAIEILREKEIEIPEENIYDGLLKVKENTEFEGRLQVISKTPFIICDCAHNAAGLLSLFEQILNMPHKKLHIVMGMVNDKDPSLNLKEYPEKASYYFCRPCIPRGLAVETLRNLATTYNLTGSSYQSVKEAIQVARTNAGNNDIILVCGSIFVVAEALEYFKSDTKYSPAENIKQNF